MMTEKMKQVLAELMQYCYDRNMVVYADMNGNKELEQHLEGLTQKISKSTRSWYESTDEEFEDIHKHRTLLRFCLTGGMGAVFFWEKKRADVEEKGLYESMEEPRTAFEMDEYIEDYIGIWWSSNSIEHNRNLRMLDDICDIIGNHYDIYQRNEEDEACLILTYLGMYIGYSRFYHDSAIETYKGDMPWHWEVWEELYGKEEKRLAGYNSWARKAIIEGEEGFGENVIQNDPQSEFGKIYKEYHPFTYNEEAGIRSLAYLENEQIQILTAVPVFDTSRNYHVIIDKVYVWGNGAEASIEVHFTDDEDCHITFYDTNYLENKDKYFVGAAYIFDIYAIAYQAKVVPEDQRSFTFEGEKAINFKKKIGEDIEFDENGLPEPITFDAAKLHAFYQTNDNIPEDAEFRAPIKAVYDDIDFLGKQVYEVEIGMPYHDLDKEDKRHPLSVYIAADTDDKLSERPVVGLPIHGVLYLQGKMRNMVNWQECPSSILHTFEAKNDDDTNAIFTHSCAEDEYGKPMTEEERHLFAMKVFYDYLSKKLNISKVDSENVDAPEFTATRNRDFWVLADAKYNALDDFKTRRDSKYLMRCYHNHRFPVIAYVTLYDADDRECEWVNGGTYTAKISYGSMLPGQKMEIMRRLDHDSLVKVMFDSYKNLNNREVYMYLHKDLDFRSCNLADVIITRDEYIFREKKILEYNKNAKEGPVQPVLLHSESEGAYIELNYPDGQVDVLKMKTEDGFITAMTIENKIEA